MYRVLAKVMDSICPTWSSRMIGVATDGAGGIRGLASRLERHIEAGLVRVWCGAHQLDLVMQRLFKALFQGQFLTSLTALIGYLRRQQTLIQTMKTNCQNLNSTRWLSMGRTANWFCKRRKPVLSFLTEKKAACSPSLSWWIVTHCVNGLMRRVDITFRKLQGMTTLVCEQTEELQELASSIVRLGELEDTNDASDDESVEEAGALMDGLGEDNFVVYGRYKARLSSIRKFVEDQGTFVANALKDVEIQDDNGAAECRRTLIAVGKMMAMCADQIHSIVAENFNGNMRLPPVLPQDLVLQRPSEFNLTLMEYKERFRSLELEAFLEKVEADFRKLKLAEDTEDEVRRGLRRLKRKKGQREQSGDAGAATDSGGFQFSFKESWATCGLNTRFSSLADFAGGLASVFPGTSTVESDFSIIKWEKDDNRTGLTDFSLEGILQAKQAQRLQKVYKLVVKQ